MSSALEPYIVPVSKNPVIDAASDIADTVYDLLNEFPESEKWDASARLHQSASYLLNSTARAIANASPAGNDFEWSNARKDAASILTMLRFAIKRGFIEKQTELILKLDTFIREIDTQIKAAYARREAYEQYELSLWEEKYKMWQKLNSEIQR